MRYSLAVMTTSGTGSNDTKHQGAKTDGHIFSGPVFLLISIAAFPTVMTVMLASKFAAVLAEAALLISAVDTNHFGTIAIAPAVGLGGGGERHQRTRSNGGRGRQR